MADTKASAFTSKTAAETASNDLFPFIDVSATGNAKNANLTRDELTAMVGTGLLFGVTGANIASATNVDLSAATGETVAITGNTDIETLGTVAAGTRRLLKFSNALTLVGSSSLFLAGPGDIVVNAGDVAEFISQGANVWKLVGFLRNDGTTIASFPTFWSVNVNVTRDDPPDAATAPAALIGTVVGVPSEADTESFQFNGVAAVLTFNAVDPANGLIWVNLASCDTIVNTKTAIASAFNGAAITGVTVSNPSGDDLQWDNTTTGASASSSHTGSVGASFSGWTGGGSGTDTVYHAGTKSAAIKAAVTSKTHYILGAYLTENSGAAWTAGLEIGASATPAAAPILTCAALTTGLIRRVWHDIFPPDAAAVVRHQAPAVNTPLYLHRVNQASDGESGAVTDTATALVWGMTI